MSLVSPKLSGFLLEEGLDFSVLRGQNWENIWTQNSAQCKETFSNNQAGPVLLTGGLIIELE